MPRCGRYDSWGNLRMRELQKRIATMQSTFRQDFPVWANTVLGATALAMIEKRVRRSGIGPDGSKYKPYSTKPTLVGAKSFTKKSAAQSVFGSKDKRRNLQWFTVQGHHLAVLPGGYKQIREIEGRQTAFKDFERTSEMWKSIHVMGTRQTATGFLTTIGTENELSNRKLSGNVDREKKEILMVTRQEEADLQIILDKYITNIVNRVMNG